MSQRKVQIKCSFLTLKINVIWGGGVKIVMANPISVKFKNLVLLKL